MFQRILSADEGTLSEIRSLLPASEVSTAESNTGQPSGSEVSPKLLACSFNYFLLRITESITLPTSDHGELYVQGLPFCIQAEV